MKNPALRILISAVLLSLVSSIIVMIIGLLQKWKMAGQFSDGYFWAGALFLSIGFINLWGTISGRTVSGLRHSQSAVHLDAYERLKIWNKDLLCGYNFLAFMMISSLLMFGLSGLAIFIEKLLY